MPLTGAQSISAREHIIGTILDQQPGSPLVVALTSAGIEMVFDLIILSETEIDALVYVDQQGIEHPLPVGHRGMLRALSEYVAHRDVSGEPVGDDWSSVTKDAFDQFRIGATYYAIHTGLNPSASRALSGTTARATRDPLTDFKKGIKRDTSLFPTLKDEKQWDTWRRTVIAQA